MSGAALNRHNARRRTALAVGLALAVQLCGCAGLPGKVEPPSVSVADITLGNIGMLEQQFKLKLRLQNPNPFDLKFDGINYELELNDQSFARGVGNQPVSIPRLGETFMDVSAVSSLAGIVRQLSSLRRENASGMRYRIHGKVFMSGSGNALPFEFRGEIGTPLPRTDKSTPPAGERRAKPEVKS